jgi:hypothetical protein
MNLRHHSSHALRVRRAGDGVASRRAARAARAAPSTRDQFFAARFFPSRRCARREPIILATRSAALASRKFMTVSKSSAASRVNVPHPHAARPGPLAYWNPWPNVPDPVSPEVVEPYQFVFDSPLVRTSMELADYARQSFEPETPLLAGAREPEQADLTDFKYDPRATTVPRHWKKSGKNAAASARILRIWRPPACDRSGLPARYVSGYLRTHPPEGQAAAGRR